MSRLPRVPDRANTSRRPEIRVALLGASNLSLLCFGIVDALALALPGRELRCFIAKGPGRAYRVEGGYLNRRFPPAGETPILEEFLAAPATDAAPPVRAAYLMDIGNDLIFGASPDEVLHRIAELSSALRNSGVPVTLALPPVLPVLRLSATRFQVIRRLLFPARPLSLERIRLDLVDLAEGIQALAGPGVMVDPRPGRHVGVDTIHCAFRRIGAMARDIADAVLEEVPDANPAPRLPGRRILREWVRWRRLPPRSMTIGGKERRHDKACYRLADEVEIRLY